MYYCYCKSKTGKKMEEKQNPHIAILPSPGMGHLIPFIELAHRLIDRHRLDVTLIVIPTDTPTAPQHSLLAGIDHRLLPPVSTDDLPNDTKPETRICLTVARSLPALRRVLESLRPLPVALVADLFGADTFEVAREFGISPYFFVTSTAMVTSFALLLPELDSSVSCEFREMPEPVRVPGFSVPVHGRDFLDPVQDCRDEAYKWTLHICKTIKSAQGVLLNSFKEMEQGVIEALQQPEPGKPPFFPIGPVVRMESEGSAGGSECLKWLDEQPPESVVFVSFGSGGCLSHQQLIELAFGLEMSEQRFLWVIRTPNDVASAAFFGVQNPDDPLSFLPEGFLERTKGHGLVVPNWAVQDQILSHGSIGGFVTHCGWNSTLESVIRGVPLIVWPLYAEQKMNAILISEDLKVGLRPKATNGSIIMRDEIARVVKSLLDGEEGKSVKERMRVLSDAAVKALSEDGSSSKALDDLVSIWKNKMITHKISNIETN